MGGSTCLLKHKTLWQLFYDIKQSITLLPGFVNPCFRVWLFQMANINEQIKNQVSGALLYKIPKENRGPSVSSKTKAQWKKEREREVESID